MTAQTGTTNGGTFFWSMVTNTARWLYQNVHQVDISPKGKLVVYQYGADLYLSNLEGLNPHLLSTNGYYLVWSPQGDNIAYFAPTAYRSGQVYELRTPAADGTLLHNYELSSYEGGQSSWRPHGKKLPTPGFLPRCYKTASVQHSALVTRLPARSSSRTTKPEPRTQIVEPD